MNYCNMTVEEVIREIEQSDNYLALALLDYYDDLKCSDNDPEEEYDRGFSRGFEDAREEAIRLIEMM